MNNYDEFILQVGKVDDFPQNIYGKLRFRIAVEKIKLPAATVFLFFFFAGILSFSTNLDRRLPFDWNLDAEEMVFSQNNNFYALFDE